MSRRFLIILLGLFIITVSPLFAWWETGHQVVARIAAQHLTAAARARIAHMLDVPDTLNDVSDALAKISTWADETKSETGTGSWHFIDLALQDKKADIPLRCPAGNCAPVRIRLFAAQLAGERSSGKWSDLDALRYVVHLVGDLHQPLHTISNADLGGNCERLNPPVDTAKSVHGLWDGGIIVAMDVDDKSLAADLEKEIETFDPARRANLARGDVDNWTWESHELAEKDVYYKLHIPVEPVEFPKSCQDAPADITQFKPQIDELYVDTMKPVVREQLEKAALRLAALLNQMH